MMHRSLIFLFCLVLTSLLSACGRPSQDLVPSQALSQMVGETVRVQFRRDALGSGAPLPVPPTTSEINGASTVLIGKLIHAESHAIVVEADGRQNWIAREVILLVQGRP